MIHLYDKVCLGRVVLPSSDGIGTGLKVNNCDVEMKAIIFSCGSTILKFTPDVLTELLAELKLYYTCIDH